MRRRHLSTLFAGLSFAALLAACGSSESDSSATGPGRESFETSYAYTRIGRLDDPAKLADVVGTGDITVTFARS